MKRATPPTVFYVDSAMPAEAVLFVAGVVRALEGIVPVALLEEEPVDLVERDAKLASLRVEPDAIGPDARVILWHDRAAPAGVRFAESWRLEPSGDAALELRLCTPRGRHRFPYVLAPGLVSPADRVVSDVPRIVVPSGEPNSRRDRLAQRVIEELRERRWRHLLVVAGPSRPELARALSPDELYDDPTAGELAALLMSATALLDMSDESVPPSVYGRLARSVGTLVVLHASSPLAQPASPEVRAAREWSPDAFCDVITTIPAGVEPELPWGMEFEAIAEDFGRIVQLG